MLAGRKVRLAALAAGMTMLAACGVHPGSAAVVGSDSISPQQVDDVAQAVCAANVAQAKLSNQPPQALGTRGAREFAIQILLESELSRQFGEHEGVQADQQRVAQALSQNEASIATLPADEQKTFRDALRHYIEGQLMLVEVGRDSLGSDSVSDNKAIAEGMRLRQKWVKTIDVEVDPRYGSFTKGAFKRGGDSLSVAASKEAKAADFDQPDATYLGTLPASQQCR